MREDKENKKKLVLFTGGLNFGGMERVIFIARDLLNKEYDIKIVTLYQTEADYEARDEYYNLNVPPSSKKIITFLKRFVKTIRMKKDLRPDMVFSFGMYLNYLNVLSNYFIVKKPTTIVGIRSYDWLTDPFLRSNTDKWIMQHANKVNSVSKMIAKDAERIWGIPLDKNQVIYNPYDVNDIIRKAEEDINDFDFDTSKYYFITMGRLSDQKGYGHLIRAFSKVSGKYANTRLLILGNGDRREKLIEMIREYDLEEKVLLLGGKNNPYRYVKKSNIYVMSSVSEGFPNALSEAMCIGTPVISVNCKSGPSEILFDTFHPLDESSKFWIADYGLLTKEMTMDKEYVKQDISPAEESLADAMIFAYEHDDYVKNLAIKAQKHMENYSYSRFKESFIKALEE